MLMVGIISTAALAAVGMSMQFMMIINVLMTLYVVGGNALISRFIGQGRKRRASALLYALAIFAIFLSVFVTFGGYFGSDSIYELMGAQADVVEQGSMYFKILSLGIVVIFIDNLLYNALSAAGDTKSSLYIKLLSAGINAFLNYVLIFGHFGFEFFYKRCTHSSGGFKVFDFSRTCSNTTSNNVCILRSTSRCRGD